MKVVELTFDDAFYVARNMREWDRREIFATRWNDDAEMLALEASSICGGLSFAAGLDRPIAAVGAAPLWPGVWSVWTFATDEFYKISTSLTKRIKRDMLSTLRAAGAHRIQCHSMIGHDDAQRWLEFLGAEREGKPIKGYGRNGEDFAMYVWR